jgi:predicted KAP-like P-loop ATPase
MKMKHHDVEIPEGNPFANCKLEREPYAKVLTEIVNTYADGFVLAINNEWGAGKTTFVKMWQQQLKNEGFQTIYFNAWENDFDNNPLVALMSELETLTNTKNEIVFKSVIEKGAVLVKNIVPALAKALIKKYVGDIDEIAVDAIENATKASTEILEEEIKEYSSKKKTIIEFRKELEKFVRQSENAKPLIFIVDELDRCRPNYAVEVLEQIKHFFSVSGIVFVLSIDKKHLGSAVKGFYGSEHIDSNEYLRRFIDSEYSIPKPTTIGFVKYLLNIIHSKTFWLHLSELSTRSFEMTRDTFWKWQNFSFLNQGLRSDNKKEYSH